MQGMLSGPMAVPTMLGVDLGLLAVCAGAGLLLLTALWWSLAGDGIAIPRDRWPGPVRAMAAAGWLLWIGGLVIQVLAHLGQVGVATWPAMGGH